LPANDADLETPFTCPEYIYVKTDDDVYTTIAGAGGQYTLKQFKNKHTNDTDNIVLTWKGKSNKAPSSSTVYLQIYNRNSTTWENLDSDSVTGADVEFTLSGSITSNHSDYYDAGNWISCRVYQG
jgi:hypothetical protein